MSRRATGQDGRRLTIGVLAQLLYSRVSRLAAWLLILTVPGYGVPVDVVTQLLPESTSPPAGIRYVNNTDVSCQGHLPCHATIQAAVNAAQPGDTVRIQSGVYTEQVKIVRKNRATADETDRITLEADPDAPLNNVVLQGARKHCTQGYAILLQQSNFITIRGLTITGAGGQAISLLGGNNQNTAIHI